MLFCFDGDAAFALEVHGVENLFGHLALREGAGHFQQAVRQRGLAVVDVRDDAEFRMNFGSIFLAYQFSQLRAGFEWPRPTFPAGLLHPNERHTQRKNRAG